MQIVTLMSHAHRILLAQAYVATKALMYLLSDSLSTKPGCAVAFLPCSSPCDSKTTAGAAHMAA